MKVGICDDEAEQRKNLIEMCKRCSQENDIDIEIVEFMSGQEVIDYCGEIITLLLLDIEMNDLDGIQVMKSIEKTNMVWKIVFVSSHTEEVWSTFGLRTLDFGKKPVSYELIKRWINVALCELDEDIIIKFARENSETCLPISNIIYLKADGNYVRVYTKSDDFLVSRNLKYWQEKLPNNHLVRIHKSYLVNFEFIDKIKEKVYLKYCQIKLPIGRSYNKELQGKYNNYIMKKIRGRL
ncbi:LytR/AlgR family response regulator transcription factor [[Clostridium] fimetarium]|uniref:Stage 0 sporulation protein A homolog n=1 Tax=[Clostridium] fimetarium TaxID=99656 RepID=A0A1I0RPQ4_9FIRM|nr:LytTR family DNA-binding domain-containing protein [[Clostridium] fimetarium]SEW43177.1 DNA-binding response regulator, LytR/AlgR family [[Clostridium] fimetarium]